MDYRKTYELILNNLCSAYRKMLSMLDKIDGFDRLLNDVSDERRPDANLVYAIAAQKERMIAQLDSISVEVEELHVKLENMMSICQQIEELPMYKYLENLQLLTYYRINAIMNEEAVTTPQVIDKLTACKESMELDLMISEVPKEQRQIFMFVPDKK
ncbi:hypothetical protein C809_00372 [Lachnospiraceae bacterium MD335]|nr:hypothetical protein C809_00372 [Lachnospiraceae bacterium MD335]